MVTTARWSREAQLARLTDGTFDLLIIGGGITGAGLAREATLAGLRTALIEREDFASGTSSRSSRLVHGGVRYLEHGHLGLVFESSQERRRLLTLAPHLVRPLAFTWPVYAGARVPRWKLRAGLALYDALALFRNVGQHEGLSRDAVLQREPALDPQGLTGGARYWDAATDDSRLTLLTVLGAAEAGETAGSVLCNHVGVVRGLHEAGRVVGVVARDMLADDDASGEVTVRARVVVNATGPWSDATLRLLDEGSGQAAAGDRTTSRAAQAQVRGSAGAHLCVPRERVGNHEAITLVSPVDGRVMFVLPSGRHTIIGTTEHPAHRGPDDICATDADVQYLLDSVNRRFPDAKLSTDDVVSAWSGIRPLAARRAGGAQGQQGTGSASREHVVEVLRPGVLNVTGGKLTTYRAMAADILRHVLRELGHAHTEPQRSRSIETPIPGGEQPLERSRQEAELASGHADVARRLAEAYGTRWRAVWTATEADATLAERLVPALPYVLAEVQHAVQAEMAATLSDVLVRRMHLAFEQRDFGVGIAPRVAQRMQALLGWSDARRDAELARYASDVARLFRIDQTSSSALRS
ncbi:MAG: glycerol-3-phosphate dehydrogenase/oxidase [Gemmatimonadaceae bacterium]|nr:glycerol-3-phosphate dehydrogenase/oxidase [Gemmatimonadaceae bacterium]